MPYLLHEHPMALLASANHPRIIEYEKTQMNNSLESILDEDVPYSIVVENITSEGRNNRASFKAFAILFFFVFFILYIQFAVSKKA